MVTQSKFFVPALAVLLLSGCASMCDSVINCEMAIRNKVLAQKAWGHWSWCYNDLDYPMHFAKGFKAGYQDVLNGGNGCQPTLPPQCYWKPAYQSPEGKCKINSWFDGFSHGALAAQQDGYGNMGEIPISPTARANIEMAQRRPDPNAFSTPYANGQPLAPVAMPPAGNEVPLVSPAESLPTNPGIRLPDVNDATQKPVVPVRPYE